MIDWASKDRPCGVADEDGRRRFQHCTSHVDTPTPRIRWDICSEAWNHGARRGVPEKDFLTSLID